MLPRKSRSVCAARHVEVRRKDGTHIRTDGQTPDRYITLTARCDHSNKGDERFDHLTSQEDWSSPGNNVIVSSSTERRSRSIRRRAIALFLTFGVLVAALPWPSRSSAAGGGGRCVSDNGGGDGPRRGTDAGSSVSNDSCFLRTKRRFVSGLPVTAPPSVTTACVFVVGVDGASEAAAVVVFRMPFIAGERPVAGDVVAGFASSCSDASQVTRINTQHQQQQQQQHGGECRNQ